MLGGNYWVATWKVKFQHLAIKKITSSLLTITFGVLISVNLDKDLNFITKTNARVDVCLIQFFVGPMWDSPKFTVYKVV